MTGSAYALGPGEHPRVTRVSNAYLASVAMHAVFIAVMIASAVVMRQDQTEETKTFELVMGEGNNFAATLAPQEGVKGGNEKIELAPSMPKIPPRPVAPPPPAPDPVMPEPSPVAPPPSPKVPEPVKPEPKALPNKVPEPKAEPSMSYAEWQKMKAQEEKAKAKAPAKTPGPFKVPVIDPKQFRAGTKDGAKTNTGFTGPGAGGKALEATEGSLLERYLQLLKNRVRESHRSPAGTPPGIQAEVEFRITLAGDITAVRVTRSSGNPEYDRSVLDAFQAVGSIGPPPNAKPLHHKFWVKADQ